VPPNTDIRPRPAGLKAKGAAPGRDAILEMRPERRDPRSKLRHVEACLTPEVEYRRTTGLECFEFVNEALPELSLAELDTGVELVGRRLRVPLMIAPMTGGTEEGLAINRRLAALAQRHGLAMGVGSQRIAIERPELMRTYRIRDLAPDVALFANFGGAQLVRGYGVDEARRAVDGIGADALFVHLNALQEAVQGGDRDFRGLADRLARLCRSLAADGIPVFAREIGFGIGPDTARRLLECGVAGIDCSGAGGTSWAKVEASCTDDPTRRQLGQRFGEWGIPTAQSIMNVRSATPTLPLIASGGLRSGIDLARAIALGADVGAMARPFLVADHAGEAALERLVLDTIAELKVCMFASGAARVTDLRGRLQPAALPLPAARTT
jgi:isopentenyl-diphosphate delta-isomerase